MVSLFEQYETETQTKTEDYTDAVNLVKIMKILKKIFKFLI